MKRSVGNEVSFATAISVCPRSEVMRVALQRSTGMTAYFRSDATYKCVLKLDFLIRLISQLHAHSLFIPRNPRV
jgi:hypothetical protein